MKKIARFFLAGLVLVASSAPALAQVRPTAVAAESATLSALDEIAAQNTARDYLVANYHTVLRARGIEVNSLFAAVATTEDGDVMVWLAGSGISAAILMSAEEYEVLAASVRFTAQ
jgi:hypothetical protein